MNDEQVADALPSGDPDIEATMVAPTEAFPATRQERWRQTMLSMMMIAVGAAVGANLRYGLSLWAAQRFGSGFPYGTLIINVSGSFVIGLVMALITTRIAVAEPIRLLIVTGLLGGYTTFSSFSYEAYSLALAGNWLLAALYMAGSVVLGFIAVGIGVGLISLVP